MNPNRLHAYYLEESELPAFVDRLIAGEKRVWGPVAKKNRFAFELLSSSDELRLDYDLTILPPKKAIFPPAQELLTFDAGGPRSAIDPRRQVLFGVHFYDIRALDQLDRIFSENHPDENYLANRDATVIVGSSIQRISPRGFWGSPGMDHPPRGQDAFLTRIPGGWLFETYTEDGEALVEYGRFRPARLYEVHAAAEANRNVLQRCRERLPAGEAEVAERLRAAYGREELWDDLARDCFSCGACNLVCPTCYCFDIQDRWNLDQESGVRCRNWDGCQLQDFSQVTLGAGGTENFRERRGQRFRHRVMRKLAYSRERPGGRACVGCGRCAAGCVPDIADPVHVVARVMEE